MVRLRSAVCWVGLVVLAVQARGIEPIPRESGLKGYVNLGVTALSVKNNTVAGLKLVDVGESKISSVFDSPDSESVVVPALNGEVSYTWAETRSQLFLGNRLEDFIRFDSTSAFGLRQEAGAAGAVEGSILFSGLPTEVWQDPFVEGIDREATDRSSTGARVAWDKIMGSRFEFSLAARKIELDTERSGEFLGLSASERRLLDREGDFYSGEFLYVVDLGARQYIVPSLRAARFDLDGDAMANDRIGAQVTYAYSWERVRLVANAYYSRAEYDARHPVYGKTRGDDLFGLAISAFWPDLLGYGNWTGVATLLYGAQDSNISFYDSEVLGAGLSALYRF